MNRKLAALVFGNSNYPEGAKLNNPTNDADDLSDRLEHCGFSVLKVVDCKLLEMEKALRKFKKTLEDSDVGLFFFAGHGMQIEGENYLNAIDTNFSEELEAKYSSLSLNKVIDVMEKANTANTATNIIILDACRNNPFERAWHRSSALRGLAPIYAPKGTIIAFATSPGEVASDGKDRNGAYTEALLRHIDTPDCSIEEMFKRVRNTLSAITKQKQTSWEHTSLSGTFFFKLSLGARIDDYSRSALCDSLLALSKSKSSHRMIKELKSYDWYTQNPVIESFDVAKAAKYTRDSLFVIGRNIYQASCGNAHGASAYIRDFASLTQGLEQRKRKALLDGMLFEIFFDSKGQLRKEFKIRKFNEVFSLQNFEELTESFDFIAECLVQQSGHFYSLPGKKHVVAVDVVTSSKSGKRSVKGVHWGGIDILWMEEYYFDQDPEGPVRYRGMEIDRFEDKLSEEMVVPSHLLTITYDFDRERLNEVLFPEGHTVRKR